MVRPRSLALNKAAYILLPEMGTNWVQLYAEVGRIALVFAKQGDDDAVPFHLNSENPRSTMRRPAPVRAIVQRARLPESCKLRLVEKTDSYLIFAE